MFNLKNLRSTNKVALILLFVALSVNNYAQTPGWFLAKGYGGSREDKGNAITVDASGNFYIVGDYMSASLVLGSSTLTNINLTSTNLFIVKVDGSGNVIWAKGFGDAGNDYAKSVKTDASGNVFVVGSFNSDSITFDGGTNYLKNACQGCGWEDLFIAKFTSTGDLLWAKKAGGVDWEYANSVAVDNNGNVFVAGSFSSDTVTFDTVTIAIPNNKSSAFLAKYNFNGQLAWVRTYGKELFNEATGVATDNSGNVYITGDFEDLTISFGTYSLINNGQVDAFLVKLNTNGTVLWAKNGGNLLYDYGKSVTTDASGNVYMTGEFNSDEITFGAYTLQNYAQASSTNDIFVAKFASDGTTQWAKSFGGSSDEYVNSIATDASNCVYVAGSFSGVSLVATPRILYNSGKNVGEMYLIKLSAIGDISYAVRATGSGDDNGTGVVTYLGTAYGTGYFKSTNMKFSWLPITTNGLYDFFFGKIGTVNSTEESATLNSQYQVYPNPSTDGAFSLQSNKILNGKLMIRVYDVLGHRVFENNQDATGTSVVNISLNDPKAGIYQLEIISEDGAKLTGKLLVR